MKKIAKLFKLAAQSIFDKGGLYRFDLLVTIGSILAPAYRFKWPQMKWWDHADFNRYLAKFDELPGMNTDRRWMVKELLRLVEHIPGDTAECGVYNGSTSYLICAANARSTQLKTHFGFDSFAGLSEPKPQDGSYWASGNLTIAEETAQQNLAEFERMSLLKGWIPDRFAEVQDHTFSFLHIDVDLMDPTRDSLEFFYSRMSEGGIILCDDYGFTTCPGVTQAVDEFFADKPDKFLSLSGGGGFMIKGSQVAPN